MATRRAGTGATATAAAAAAHPRRARTATAAQPLAAAPGASEHGPVRGASRRIRAVADPPGECPWCMSELGLPGTAGTTTRLCRWHELTGWIAIATRYPSVWPKVRAEFGEVVLLRLVGRDEAPAGAGAAMGGALVVDIAVG